MKTSTAPSKPIKSQAKICTKAPKSPRRKLYLAIAAQLLAMSAPVWAGPEGGVVTGGGGSIDHSGTTTTITQNTDRLSIDWDSFDVSQEERVQFIQPTQDSVALNRILGGDASNILGQIDANGHVILMNPNGVLFGEGASVNVGGLIATGLSVDPSDFMNGDFALKSIDGSGGAVVNAGVINASTGGNIALIGQSVENSGLISAKLGTVTLAAGTETIVSFDSKGLLGVKVTKEVLQDQIGVSALHNSGDIQAEGGRVLLTSSVSQDIFTQAVNAGDLNAKTSVLMHDDGSFTLGGGADVVNTGSINVSSKDHTAGRVVVIGENIKNSGAILADNLSQASTTAERTAGSIELHAANITELSKASHISASAQQSGKGGDVKVLGDKIDLFDQSNIIATGSTGGGSILVGGDQEGKNPLVRNAEFLYLGEESNIDASALANGDGGTIITFAADTTRVHGRLSARGGDEGGNGGFIETSGLEGFVITSAPDTSAENGTAGSWLIDPYDLTIGASFPNDGYSLTGGTFTSEAPTGASQGGSNISAALINSAFDSNNDVIIKTGAGGNDAGIISITGTSAININASAGQSLTLEAHDNISFSQSFNISGADLHLESGNTVLIDNNIDTNGGDLTIQSGNQAVGLIRINNTITTQGGDVSLHGPDTVIANSLIDTLTGGAAGQGNVTLTGGANYIGIRDFNVGGNFNVVSAGDVSFTTENGISVLGNINVEAQSGQAIYGGFLSANDSVDVSAGGNLTIKAATQLRLYNSPTKAFLNLDAGNDLNLSGANDFLLDYDANYDYEFTANGAMTIISTAGSIIDNDGVINPKGSLTLIATGDITSTTNFDMNGDFEVRGATDVNLSGGLITGGGNVSIQNISSNLTLSPIVTNGGDITIDAPDSGIIPTGLQNGLPGNNWFFDTKTGGTSGQGNINLTGSDLLYLLEINAGGDIIASAPSLTLANGNTHADGNIELESTTGNLGFYNENVPRPISAGGDITIISNGTVELQPFLSGGFPDLVAGNNLTIEARDSITIPSNITAGNTVRITSATGDIDDSTASLHTSDNFFLSAAGDITSTASFNLNNADFNVVSATTADLSGGITTAGGNVNIQNISSNLTLSSILTNGGDITIDAPDSGISSAGLQGNNWLFDTKTGGTSGQGDINLTGSDTLFLWTSNAGGDIIASAPTLNLASGDIHADGSIELESLTGNVGFYNDTQAVPTPITADGDITIISNGEIELLAFVAGGFPDLVAGNNVTIEARDSITIPSNISAGNTVRLTSATGDINDANGSLHTSDNFFLSAAGDITSSSSFVLNGDFEVTQATNMDFSSFIETQGGDVKITSNTITRSGSLRTEGGSILINTINGIDGFTTFDTSGGLGLGNMSVNASSGPVNLGFTTVTGDLSVAASGGDITIIGDVVVSNNLVFNTDGQILTASVASDPFYNVSANNITIDAIGAINLAGPNRPTIHLDARNNLSLTTDIDFTAVSNLSANGLMSITSTTGDIDLSLSPINTTGNLNLAGENITIDNQVDSDAITLNANNDINIGASGVIDTNGGDFTAVAAGNFNLSGVVDTSGGNLGIDVTNDFSYSSGSALVSFGGNIDVKAREIDGALQGAMFNSESANQTGNITITSTFDARLPFLLVDNDLNVSASNFLDLSPEGANVGGNANLNANLIIGAVPVGSAEFIADGNIQMTASNGGQISLAGSTPLVATNNITLIAPGSSGVPSRVELPSSVRAGNDITIDAFSIFQLASNITAQNLFLRGQALNHTGDITANISNQFDISMDGITLGDITLTGADVNITTNTLDIDVGTINTGGGDISLSSAGSIIVNGQLSPQTGDISLSSTAGAISLSEDTNFSGNFFATTSAGDFSSRAITTNGGDITIDTTTMSFGGAAAQQATYIFDTTGTAANGNGNVSIITTGGVFSPIINTSQGDIWLESLAAGITAANITGADTVNLVGASSSIETAGIQANNLDIYVRWPLTQTGAWNISDTTRLSVDSGGANVILTNPANNLNIFTANTNFQNNNIQLVESDGITLTDITGFEGLSVQSPDILIDGAITGDASTNMLVELSGDNTANTVTITPNAAFTNFFDTASYINLGAGNDVVNISSTVPIDILGGAGDDQFNLLVDNITLRTLDGGAGTDTLDAGNLEVKENYFAEVNAGNISLNKINIETTTSTTSPLTDVSLYGVDGYNAQWIINADDSVDVIVFDNVGTEVSNLNFINKTTLSGADGTDNFVYSSEANNHKNLVGGTGQDSISFVNSNADLTWELSFNNQNQILNVVDFVDIESVIGSSGNDTFRINQPNNVTSIDAGTGDNTLIGADVNASYVWAITGANQGVLDAINFSNITNLAGNDNNDDFTIADGASISGLIFGGGGNDSLYVQSSTDQTWVLDQANNDSIAGVVNFNEVENITGGSGDSNFIIAGTTAVTNIDGNQGVNTLTAANQANSWIVDSTNQGSLNSSRFTNIENLVGGDNSDDFVIHSGGSISGSITGGAGSDGLTMSDTNRLRWDIASPTGNDSVIEAGNTLIQFSNIESINGTGDTYFVFNGSTDITSITGNGSTDSDLLGDFITGSTALIVNLSSSSLNYYLADDSLSSPISFSGINSFRVVETVVHSSTVQSQLIARDTDNTWTLDQVPADTNPLIQVSLFDGSDTVELFGDFVYQGGAGIDTLIGHQTSNGQTWTIDADNSGSVTSNVNFNFTNFESLVGSVTDDTFNLSAHIDSIDGGLGNNVLVGGNNVNDWSITTSNTGTLNATQFDNIQTLIGGTDSDTFIFTANSSIDSIDASAGDDTVTLANDVTVNSIDGGDGVDILDLAGQNSIIDFLGVLSAGTTTFAKANFEQQLSGPDGQGGLVYFGGDGVNNWLIDGEGTGTLTKIGGANAGSYNIPADVVSLLGGSGTDNFTVTDTGSIKNGLSGGGGSDNSLSLQGSTNSEWLIDGADQGSVTFSNNTLLFTSIANIVGTSNDDTFELASGGSISGSISGGLGADLLLMSDPTPNNLWTLGSLNSVNSINAFDGIESLVSNTNIDTFNITASTDVSNISARGESNVINWTGSDLEVDLINSTLNASIIFAGISEFNADQNQSNSFTGSNEDSTWLLSSHGAGTLSSTTSNTSFSNFNTLNSGTGLDSLTGLNEITSWQIEGVNSGSTSSDLGQTWFSGVESILAGSENDTFILNSLDAEITNGIIGGAGTNDLIGFSGMQNTWSVSSDYSGTVNNGMTFSQINNIQGGDLGDTFQVSSAVTIDDLTGGQGDDSFTIGNAANIGIIQAEAGDDIIDVDNLATIVNVDGGAGIDTLDLVKLDGAVQINYLGEQDTNITSSNVEDTLVNPNTVTFFGGDGNNRWVFDGDGSGSLFKLDGPDQGQYDFVDKVNFLGGDGNDEFVMTATANIKGYIDGGAANNIIAAKDIINDWLIDGQNSGTLNGSDGSTALFRNIAEIIGADTAADTFTIANGGLMEQISAGSQGTLQDRLVIEQSVSAAWSIGASNSQVLISGDSVQFSGINIIDASLGDDTFSITANQAELSTINARGGSNSLDITSLTQDTRVNLQEQTAAWMSVSDFNAFAANASTNNTFIGLNQQAVWTLSDSNSATVEYQNSNSVQFSGFSVMEGGSETDQFVLTGLNAAMPLPTSINGGLGEDELISGNTDNAWQLDSSGGQLNGNRFEAIEQLTGGTGQDHYILTSSNISATTLNAGPGDNSVTGFNQDNTWTINNDNTGTINTVSFNNIQTFIGGSSIDSFTVEANTALKDLSGSDGDDLITIGANSVVDNVNGGGGDDLIVINEGLVVNGSIDGGTTGETNGDFLDITGYTVDTAVFDIPTVLGFIYSNFFDISQPSIRDTLFGGDGTNYWYITGPDQGRLEVVENGSTVSTTPFQDVKHLIGGTGDDFFIFETDTAAITEEIEGGTGTGINTIDLGSQNLVNQWILDGANNGSVINSANPNGNIFIEIASIIGSKTNVDTLINNASNIAATWTMTGIDQGSVAIDTGTTSFQGIESIVGGQLNSDRILGSGDQAYSWSVGNLWSGSVTGPVNTGQSLNFENIATIIGGNNDDNFQISNNTNISIDGGDAVNGDFVDYSQYNANLSINLDQSLGGDPGVITGIETIRGNHANTNSINSAELIGSENINSWAISDFDGQGSADGINDGTYTSGTTVVHFIDFNILSGGSNTDTFDQTTGVIEGTIYGNGGNDHLNISLANSPATSLNNTGTQFVGGDDNDTLNISGGYAEQVANYTSTSNGGQFEYIEQGTSYIFTHEAVELINETSLANTLALHGTNDSDLLALANGSFSFDQSNSINYANKANVIANLEVNDTVEITDNILLAGSLTVRNASLISNDVNTSITADTLTLESTQNIGSNSNFIRTSIDNLVVRNAKGAINLQEQDDLIISEFSTNSEFKLNVLNGDLTSSAELTSNQFFDVTAENGNISLTGQNKLSGDVSLTADTVVLINAETIYVAAINSDSLYLTSGGDIEQTGVIAVTEETVLQAGNNIVLNNEDNDFNSVSIIAAQDVSTSDQNGITLNDVTVGGNLTIESSGLNVDQNVTADTINLNTGTGNFVQSEQSTVTAGGDINVSSGGDISVSTITTSTSVNLASDTGSLIDVNGDGKNINADSLVVSVGTGVGAGDALETQVGKLNVNTESGDLNIANDGNVTVEKLTTTAGNIDLGNSGDVDLESGSVSASVGIDGVGGGVSLDTRGDLKQVGSIAEPAVKAEDLKITSDGEVGAGGIFLSAKKVIVNADKQAGELITPPGTTRDVQFSGTFTFEDQLLVVEQFDDVSPAVFSNVKGYFYNDVSLKLSADQLYDDEGDEEDDDEY